MKWRDLGNVSPKEFLRIRKESWEVQFYESVREKHQFFCGIGIATFKWILGRTNPNVKCYHLQLTFDGHLLLVLMKKKWHYLMET